MATQFTTILDMNLTSDVSGLSTGPAAPGAPGTLSLVAGSPPYTVINLSWSAPADNGNSPITGYRIKKDNVILVADTSSTGTTYSATGLTNSTSYTFTVAAINAYGTGPDGNTPTLATSAYTVPGAPGTLSLAAGGAASTEVDLTWSTPASDGGQTISGYRVQKSTNGSSWSDVTATTGSSATTYTATGLTQNTQYWFRVAAINSIGTGADSNEPNITTANVMSWTATGTYTTGTDGSNTWVKWTSTGNFVVSNVAATADIFVSAGGGSGAKAGGVYYGPYGGAGGGGGGGALTTTGVTVGVGTHVATVGDGAASPGTSIGVNGSRGNNSMFAVSGGSTYTGQGGGHGSYNANGENAGCGGGGGGVSTTSSRSGGTGSQGGDGGNSYGYSANYHFGGGGGGMGGDATNGGDPGGTDWKAGDGGTDQSNSYTGSAIAYGGGGGGQGSGFDKGDGGGTTGTDGHHGQGNVATPAANSSGGSGAGSLYVNGAGGPFSGAAGGSGVVVIRFPTP